VRDRVLTFVKLLCLLLEVFGEVLDLVLAPMFSSPPLKKAGEAPDKSILREADAGLLSRLVSMRVDSLYPELGGDWKVFPKFGDFPAGVLAWNSLRGFLGFAFLQGDMPSSGFIVLVRLEFLL